MYGVISALAPNIYFGHIETVKNDCASFNNADDDTACVKNGLEPQTKKLKGKIWIMQNN
jgi:hypothetical protein